jgi:hypothetical protein
MNKFISIFFYRVAKIIERAPKFVFMLLKAGKALFQNSDVSFENGCGGIINVLGNGPSCHSTFQKNRTISEHVMVVNFFGVTDEFHNYKPSHYVLMDPLFFEDNSERFMQLYKSLNEVDWDMTLFVPFIYNNVAKKLILSTFINVKSIKSNYYPGDSKMLYALYKRNLATPRFQNVINACLYLSVNNGYSEIKLHGVEADEFKNFSIDNNNDVILESEHFYGKSNRNLSKEGLIIKGNFYGYLKYYAYMLQGFSEMEKYSKFMRCQILNYTKTSCIDSFDRHSNKPSGQVKIK